MDIAADWNGNSYVAGQFFTSASKSVYRVRSYNYDTGALQWGVTTPSYGPAAGLHIPRHIALDRLDDTPAFVYVTGESPDANGSLDIATLKIDATTGAVVWSRRYTNADHPAGNDVGRFVAIKRHFESPSLDIVYVCGYSEGKGTGKDFVILKYDAAGTLSTTWPYLSAAEPAGVRRYDFAEGSDDAVMLVHGVSVGPLDGAPTNWVALAGTSFGGTSGNDIATHMYDDDDGTIAWTARYDHFNGNDRCVGLFKNSSEDTIYPAGTSQHHYPETDFFVPYSDDFVALAYSAPSGNPSSSWAYISALEPQGVRRYDSGDNDVCYAAATEQVSALNLTLVGSSAMPSLGGWNYRWVRWQFSDGALLWAEYADGGAGLEDRALDVVCDSKMSSYITGFGYRVSGQRDMMTVRIEPGGTMSDTDPGPNKDWPQWYGGTGGGDDTGNGVAVWPQHFANPDVFVTGGAVQNSTGLDWRTQQYKYVSP